MNIFTDKKYLILCVLKNAFIYYKCKLLIYPCILYILKQLKL